MKVLLVLSALSAQCLFKSLRFYVSQTVRCALCVVWAVAPPLSHVNVNTTVGQTRQPVLYGTITARSEYTHLT